MAVRHQHGVDLRQRVERNTGIVVPLRPGKAERRGAHRPHRIDQDVEARGLDQPARMADKRQPDLGAGHARRRRVGMRARRPVRPGRAVPAATKLPAQHLAQGFRRRTIGIEEGQAVEMIGGGAVIGFHAGHPDRRRARGQAEAGKYCKNAAAGDGHRRDHRGRAKGIRRYMACVGRGWNCGRSDFVAIDPRNLPSS